ncbi:hypothetical protein Droror1_Dr00028207 [Drosera rotundifolia]
MREFRRSCHGRSYDQVDSETEEAPELGRFLSAYSLGDCVGFENVMGTWGRRRCKDGVQVRSWCGVAVVKGLSSSGIQVVADSNLWSSIVPGVLLAVWSSFEYVLVLVRIRSPRLGVKGVLLRFCSRVLFVIVVCWLVMLEV